MDPFSYNQCVCVIHIECRPWLLCQVQKLLQNHHPVLRNVYYFLCYWHKPALCRKPRENYPQKRGREHDLFSSNNSSNQRQHSPVPDLTPGSWALCCSKSLAGEHWFPPTASHVCSELPWMVLSRKQGCESPHLLLTSVMVSSAEWKQCQKTVKPQRCLVFSAPPVEKGIVPCSPRQQKLHDEGCAHARRHEPRENWSLYFPISIFYITGV